VKCQTDASSYPKFFALAQNRHQDDRLPANPQPNFRAWYGVCVYLATRAQIPDRPHTLTKARRFGLQTIRNGFDTNNSLLSIRFIRENFHMAEQKKHDHRATLTPSQLFQLTALENIELDQSEKDRLTSDYLFVLAITNKLRLNEHDLDRLRPLHLAHLAITGKIELRQEDKDRLPDDLLFDLFR
jgi:hypothetical protein